MKEIREMRSIGFAKIVVEMHCEKGEEEEIMREVREWLNKRNRKKHFEKKPRTEYKINRM